MRITKVQIIKFPDFPDFQPNLSPTQIFQLGSFGGSYWRPIFSKVTNKRYGNLHLELPNKWWKNIPENYLINEKEDLTINQYKVHSGTNLEYWESRNWINSIDPYGWVQWYCHFYNGRRTEDDIRQINRWINFAGSRGRWKIRLINNILKEKASFNTKSISPVIRQALQQWAYQITFEDLETEKWNK